MKKFYNTTFAIISALLFGIFFHFCPVFITGLIQAICQKFGQVFLNGLMMGVLPLILTSLILGAAKITLRSDASKIAPRVLIIFGANSLAASLLASTVFFVFSPLLPGIQTHSHDAVIATSSLSDLLVKIFPRNIFKALADLDMIGLIVFFLFFGASLGQVSKRNEEFTLIHSVQIIFDTILTMIRSFMVLLPLGVFCLVLDAVLRFEFATVHSLAVFLSMFALTIAGYLVMWFLLAQRLTGHSFMHILKDARSVLVSGFSTSSSAVSLPIALDVLENKFSVNPDLSRFLMPLGITVNMAGTTLFVSLSSLYIAGIQGFELNLPMHAYLVILSWLTCLGTAGIPSGCLISLMIVLSAIGIPNAHDAIGVLIGIDRLLDMIRTSINLLGNLFCTLAIDKNEKQLLNF